MTDIVIGIILMGLLAVGIVYTRNHFKKKSGCCSGPSTVVSKKKLKHVIGSKTYIVEGMTCENCKNRVERYINDVDGIKGKVNLKKNELVVSYERDITDQEIIDIITKAGYTIKA